MRTISFFDTTLRDGEQAPGCSMKLPRKLEIAKELENIGVDIIEAGFPISSPDDFEAVREVAKTVRKSGVAALCRATTSDISCAWEAIRHNGRPRLNIFLATSDIHIEHKLKRTREWVLEAAAASVRFARSLCPEVQFTAEDATRSDRDFLAEVFRTAEQAGATTVCVADTVGYAAPEEMAELFRYLKRELGLPVSVHCHNDLGMAAANTLSAIRAGADQADVTLGGIGERAGMAALEEIAMALKTRGEFYGAQSKLATRYFYRASKLLSSVIDMDISPIKPIVGANAFSHEAGVHQHGIIANPLTYEIMRPEDVGIYMSKMILGKHSGKKALEERLGQLGFKLGAESLEEVFTRFKQLADKKRALSDIDLEELVKGQESEAQTYVLNSFVINSGTDITATALVRLERAGEIREHVARGETPVIAAFKAVDKIVKHSYPLYHFTINSISEGRTALGESIVQVQAGDQVITGRGTHTDIVEACIRAYVSAINRAISREA